MFKRLALATALTLSMSVSAIAASYTIDTKGAHASINFRKLHFNFSFLTGRFDTFSGKFDFDPENPEAGSVSLEIDTNSLNTNHAERDNHLRSKDFFEVSAHPKATFVSTSTSQINVLVSLVNINLVL